MNVQRIRPASCQDVRTLSRLLDLALRHLEKEPTGLSIQALSYDSGIPARAWIRLRQMHQLPGEPEDALMARDFHVAFANLSFRYPTLKIWSTASGAVFIEL